MKNLETFVFNKNQSLYEYDNYAGINVQSEFISHWSLTTLHFRNWDLSFQIWKNWVTNLKNFGLTKLNNFGLKMNILTWQYSKIWT